jgi:LacI family transcriptional regulator
MRHERLPRAGQSSNITLAAVAKCVGLTAGTVSAVLNNSSSARSIPERTKNRIFAAARELDYRPNIFAQLLRGRRSNTIGVMVNEIEDPCGSAIVSGIEQYLRTKDYFFLTVAHRHDPVIVERSSHILMQRGVEGFIFVDMALREAPPLPSIVVAGRCRLGGVPNVVVNHLQAARLALRHLRELGHTNIAFIRGPLSNPEAEDRWKAVCEAAKEFGIEVNPEQTVQIESNDAAPCLAYPIAKKLLELRMACTALFAYNDVSAIGAIRAFQENGLHVPLDISVVGFDDIQGAAYSTPSLTTVREPRTSMGAIAAQTLLERLEYQSNDPTEIAVEPELVIRESTRRRQAQA